MGRGHKEFTNNIQELIIFQRISVKSIWNITKLVNLSHSTVQYVIKCFKEENKIENNVRKGRSKKLTKRDETFIIKKIVKNPHLNAVKISVEFNEKFSTTISLETVWWVVREARLHRFLPVKIFLLVRKTESLDFQSQNQ